MWRFLISILACAGLILVLDNPVTISGLSLPPMGRFMSPSHGFWQNAETNSTDQLADRVEGLSADVQVVFDDRLVPHVFASNVEDLFFAQGYVTAMHRLWQMDITVRAAAGCISEILGERALGFDRRQRHSGMTFAAENSLRAWERDSNFVLIEAYTAGVNAYIDCLRPRKFPIEYKLLKHEPEYWTPLKCALFYKSMASRLCMREYDLEYTQLLSILGPERLGYLFPDYNPAQDPVIPPGTPWNFDPVPLSSAAPVDSLLPDLQYNAGTSHIFSSGQGSNNWAVAGSKTASGYPILCNDPHLDLSLPSVWYEMELHAPGYHCRGVTLPGVPTVIIGFNNNVAWGLTNVNHDVLDWYYIKWANKDRTAYLLDGDTVAAELRVEHIGLPGGRKVTDTVRYTIWGPVIEDGPHAGMAMRWLAHDGGDAFAMSTYTRLNQAQTMDDMLQALDAFHTPAQNFALADRQGHVGLRIGGRLPLRREGHGKFIQDGSNSRSAWAGYIPVEHNPVVVNPARGFVSSANQRTTDRSYPYYYSGGRYFEDYRGRYINMALSEMDSISIQDMQDLQNSSVSLKAAEILPHLLLMLDSTALANRELDVYERLKGWDMRYAAHAVAPVMFEIWYGEFYSLVWDEFEQHTDSLRLMTPESWRTIDLALTRPDDPVFDIQATDQRESFRDVARESFQLTIDSLSKLGDPYPDWGTFRPVIIDHLINRPGFNVVMDNVSGHGDALNANTGTVGPSWRMIVHLKDTVEAYVVYPGGQSGNPGSVYYDDMVNEWKDGLYYRVGLNERPTDIAAHMTLQLITHR